MKNKNNTPQAPDLADLQKRINEFYFWSNSKTTRSALFDLLTYAMQSPDMAHISGTDRSELVTTVKLIGDFVTDMEEFSSARHITKD